MVNAYLLDAAASLHRTAFLQGASAGTASLDDLDPAESQRTRTPVAGGRSRLTICAIDCFVPNQARCAEGVNG
jgi:hypothetical protein